MTPVGISDPQSSLAYKYSSRTPFARETRLTTQLSHEWEILTSEPSIVIEQGIPIHERVPIPEELIPEDSRVEIDAKIHAGYCESIYSCLGCPARILSRICSHNREGIEYGRIVRGARPCMGRR